MKESVFKGYKYKFKFNASHYLDLEHPESAHSHTFHMVFYIENASDLFVSYNEIEKYISSILNRYRGQCLNNIPSFNEVVPTLENICEVVYEEIDQYCISLGLNLVKIEISDNSVSWYALSEILMIDSINNVYQPS
jgi:6-pyruvoyltetrahydropterin/6-carboxytetrahydropterin synthase